jgi:nicotinamidase-related amidase
LHSLADMRTRKQAILRETALFDKRRETLSIDRDTVLLLIDVQEGFKDPKWGRRNNPCAEAKIAQLLNVWRVSGWPIIHVQHVSQEHASVFAPESPGFALQEFVRPANGELLVQKRVNSAFIGTKLDRSLKERGATTLVVVGFTTDHCVSSTVRMASNLGYRTIVVADGTATFERRSIDNKPVDPEIIHQVHLLSLQGEFAEVLDADMVLSLSENYEPACLKRGF